jgi:hypothetical protein
MKQQHIYQIVFLLTPTPNNTNTVVYLKAGLEILKVNFTLRSCRGWGTLIITIRCRCVPQVGFVNIKTVFHLSCYLFCSSAGEGTIITVTTFCLPLGPQILTLSTFRLCVLRDVEKETQKQSVVGDILLRKIPKNMCFFIS